jgi:hypothetical protein
MIKVAPIQTQEERDHQDSDHRGDSRAFSSPAGRRSLPEGLGSRLALG